MDKVAMLNDILTQNPGDAFARYGLALEYANQGQTDVALGQFNQLLAAHPDYVAGYQMSGQLLFKLGRLEEAKQRLEEGIASASRNGNAHARAEMEALLDEIET
jgi:predicted Zn-dependent protease